MINLVDALMTAHDFKLIDTGGGCTAYEHIEENEDYILITDLEDPIAPQDLTSWCLITLYNKDNYKLKWWTADSVNAALHIAKWYVSEYYGDYDNA